MVSDYTPAGMKAVNPNAVIKWDRVYAETAQMISMCATTDTNVITGAVILIGGMLLPPLSPTYSIPSQLSISTHD